MLFDRGTRGADVGATEIHGVAVGQDAGAPDVDQRPGRLRRRPGDGHDVVDPIRALRSGVDESGHAVGEADRRTVFHACRVRMDVDQAGHDDLAARVDGVRGIGLEIRFRRPRYAHR